MLKVLTGLLWVFLLGWRLPQAVIAAGEFQADYDVSYAIAPAGKTIVTQRISLTNKLTNYYPQRYSLTLDSDKITNVIAYDDGGVISPTINIVEGKTEIGLTFNKQVVGIGKQLSFTVRYEHGDIAHKVGSIWEVYVPGVVDDPDIDRYNVTLQVPPTFGTNAYLSPPPALGRKWTKEQMVQGGISGAWGNKQSFLLELSYHLTNPRLTPVLGEIALPPDTAFQKVVIQSLVPAPVTVRQDADGNWLAQYRLGSGQNLAIKAKVAVAIFLQARADFPAPNADRDRYLKPDKYWEVNSPQIQELAKTQATPRQIYDYVIRTLSYDYNRVNQNPQRKGAVGALANPLEAICMEFTDLFIAIARAAGIPARENVGYAYTTNARLRPLSLVADVLHAWPEYYDAERKLWVPVDPTWANTTGGVNYFDKLDFDHIVFAIRGESSTAPAPAGFYKEAGRAGKDVSVRFAEADLGEPTPVFAVAFQFAKAVAAGTRPKGSLIVENTSGVVAYNVPLLLEAPGFGLRSEHTEEAFLPYERVEIPFSLTVPQSVKRGQGVISATVNSKVDLLSFDIQPKYGLLAVSLGFLAVTIGAVLLAIRSVWQSLKKK